MPTTATLVSYFRVQPYLSVHAELEGLRHSCDHAGAGVEFQRDEQICGYQEAYTEFVNALAVHSCHQRQNSFVIVV